MSKKLKGFVEAVKTSKVRGGTMYRMKLQDDKNWYGSADKDPGVERGDYVGIVVAQEGDWWNLKAKPKKLKAPKGESVREGKGKSDYSRGSNPETNRAIIMQNAYTQANAVLTTASAYEMLPIAKNKKVGEKMEALLIVLHETAAEIADKVIAFSKDEAPKAETAKKTKKADEESWGEDEPEEESEEEEAEEQEEEEAGDDWDD